MVELEDLQARSGSKATTVTAQSSSSGGDLVGGELDRRLATLWRMESPRLIARLVRLVGDLDSAQEIAQDVFVAALEKWRSAGVPENPAGWLSATGRYLAVDLIRRRDTQRGKYRLVAALVVPAPAAFQPDVDESVDADLADDLLGLIFMACHPRRRRRTPGRR